MLIRKTSPSGVDITIDDIQTRMHDAIMEAWGLNSANATQNKLYKCYGRCYKNTNETGSIAEVYIGDKEYKEIYHDDSLYGISFFGISDSIEMGVQNTVDAHLVFFVNLSKIKPAVQHRADEEARVEITNILGAGQYACEIKGVDLTIEKALREYDGSFKRLRHIDMHPIHCFRINLVLNYQNILTNCSTFSNF